MASRLAAGIAAVFLLALSAPPSAALGAPSHVRAEHATPIGGPLLGSSGVVVQPSAGAPPLPAPSQLPAASWLVANLTTGEVLAAKAPHAKFLPASTLKMLTAVTLIPRLDPHAMFPISYRAAVVDGTRAGLSEGKRYQISTLFQCMLEMSANDAAEALAQAYGSVKNTLRAMNIEAWYLQANDTHADTPSGLDGPGETTSAYDLALIAQAAFKIPAFRHYITQASSVIPAAHHRHFQIQSHNDLLTTYRGDIGGKNGYTVAAQATYVGAARRHGQTILVSLMHGYPDWAPMARALLNWGFQANGKVTPVGQLVQPLPPKQPVTPKASTVAQTSVADAGTPHKRRIGPLVETLAVMVTAFVAGMTAVRRMWPRRGSSRLKLPRI
ncbi:MAG TPA: serine hydrolase [Mycobacteriales bacterium]|nr:serine hydrolase [Mycobacteriales bacterium]